MNTSKLMSRERPPLTELTADACSSLIKSLDDEGFTMTGLGKDHG